jgi:hypothetical protein
MFLLTKNRISGTTLKSSGPFDLLQSLRAAELHRYVAKGEIVR